MNGHIAIVGFVMQVFIHIVDVFIVDFIHA